MDRVNEALLCLAKWQAVWRVKTQYTKCLILSQTHKPSSEHPKYTCLLPYNDAVPIGMCADVQCLTCNSLESRNSAHSNSCADLDAVFHVLWSVN